MFATVRGLGVVPHERDCFAAHEVLQMEPVWEQRGTYQKFLAANAWAKRFLPNAWDERLRLFPQPVYQTPHLVVWVFKLFEFWAKIIQLLYMEPKRTSEIVTDSVLRFHPNDARIWVKRELTKRLKRFNVPLDIVFYAS